MLAGVFHVGVFTLMVVQMIEDPKPSLIDRLKLASPSTLLILECRVKVDVVEKLMRVSPDYVDDVQRMICPDYEILAREIKPIYCKNSFTYMECRKERRSEVHNLCYKECVKHASHLGWKR